MKIALGKTVCADRNICGPYVLFNVDLPEEVVSVVSLIQERLRNKVNDPVPAYYDVTGHGGNQNLVLMPGIRFCPNNLSGLERVVFTRISLGKTPDPEDGPKGDFVWDFSDYNTMHVCVYGKRTILPKDLKEAWRNRFFRERYYELCRAMENQGFTGRTIKYRVPIEESVNFSLRWKEDIFQSRYSDQSSWDGGIFRFHVLRTTRYSAVVRHGVIEPKDRELIRFNRRGQLKRSRLTMLDIVKDEKDGRIGYRETLRFLSDFGGVKEADYSRFGQESIKDSMGYLFAEVLGAVENFVRSE